MKSDIPHFGSPHLFGALGITPFPDTAMWAAEACRALTRWRGIPLDYFHLVLLGLPNIYIYLST